MRGFLTKSELSEARMLTKLDTLSDWQKTRIVKLYTKQMTGNKISLTTHDDGWSEEWVGKSLVFFRG